MPVCRATVLFSAACADVPPAYQPVAEFVDGSYGHEQQDDSEAVDRDLCESQLGDVDERVRVKTCNGAVRQ